MGRRLLVAGLNVRGLALTLTLFAVARSSSTSAQTDDRAPVIPKFRAESRQVLVEVNVWNPGAKKMGLSSEPGPQFPKGWPTPARGLGVKDFRVFDNGVEQKTNFLKELDFDQRLADPWAILPDGSGLWGSYNPGEWWEPTATYLIGYAPPLLQPGECRTVWVGVEGHDVDLNRTEYCSPTPAGSALLADATTAENKMQTLANLHPQRAIKLSIQAFSFWSSGVLRLLAEPQTASGSDEPGSDYRYVVEVHDTKAPATVHVSTEFHWRDEKWYVPDCFKKNPTIQIFGTVYKANGEVETEFKDSTSCLGSSFMRSAIGKYAVKHRWISRTVVIPTRFDTELRLPPGYYRLRVFVSDGTSVGQAEIPIHVEPFEKDRLGISDIVLAGIVRDKSWVPREAAVLYPAPMNPTPLVSKDVQFLPAVKLHIPKQTPIWLYLEIYESLLESDNVGVYYRMRITDLKTGATVMNTEPISAKDFVVPGNSVVPIGLKLNSDKLHEGAYKLEVQASDSAGHESEWQSANVSIQ